MDARQTLRLAVLGQSRLRALVIVGGVVAYNLVAWLLFVAEILPRHFHYQGLGIGLGVGLTAWSLGARHAFDADHIAAIDNATRKLMAEGKRPLASGLFFALGHNTTILAAGAGLAVATHAVYGAVVKPSSAFESAGGVVGTSLAGAFLWLLAAVNFLVLRSLVELARRVRREGKVDELGLEELLGSRGFLARLLRRYLDRLRATWQLYFVGLVFAIGFDTATEVLLLSGTATAASVGLPFYAVMALPVLFSAGLILFDTLDGLFMNTAYGWAFALPGRRLLYNLAVTALSVAVAFLIGAVELGGVLVSELRLHGSLASFLSNFNINTAGFIVVALFLVVWAAAAVAWRLDIIPGRNRGAPGSGLE